MVISLVLKTPFKCPTSCFSASVRSKALGVVNQYTMNKPYLTNIKIAVNTNTPKRVNIIVLYLKLLIFFNTQNYF